MDWENRYGANGDAQGEGMHNISSTGFASAADDHESKALDLNEQLVYNRSSTFYFRMNGDAMSGAGIQNGDILVVDKSLKAANGKIIIASVNGELLVRRFQQGIRGFSLVAEHPRYNTIEIGEFTQFEHWGLVTCVIHILEKGLLDHRPAKRKR